MPFPRTQSLYYVPVYFVFIAVLFLAVSKSEILQTDGNRSVNPKHLNWTKRVASHVPLRGRARRNSSDNKNNDDNVNTNLQNTLFEKFLSPSETKSRGTERSNRQAHVSFSELFTAKEGKAEVWERREGVRKDVDSASRKLEAAGNYLKTVMENGRHGTESLDMGRGELWRLGPVEKVGHENGRTVSQMEDRKIPDVGDRDRSHGGVILSLGKTFVEDDIGDGGVSGESSIDNVNLPLREQSGGGGGGSGDGGGSVGGKMGLSDGVADHYRTIDHGSGIDSDVIVDKNKVVQGNPSDVKEEADSDVDRIRHTMAYTNRNGISSKNYETTTGFNQVDYFPNKFDIHNKSLSLTKPRTRNKRYASSQTKKSHKEFFRKESEPHSMNDLIWESTADGVGEKMRLSEQDQQVDGSKLNIDEKWLGEDQRVNSHLPVESKSNQYRESELEVGRLIESSRKISKNDDVDDKDEVVDEDIIADGGDRDGSSIAGEVVADIGGGFDDNIVDEATNGHGYHDNNGINDNISDDIKDHADDNETDDDVLNQHQNSHNRVAREALTSSLYSEIANNKNIRARKEGDFIIGALFPLHQAPTQKTAFSRQCGEIREYYGIQRVEVFLMTLDDINNDDSILRNITLGWDIRDSCWYSAIALENSIDFIKDAIAGQSQSQNPKQMEESFSSQFDVDNSSVDSNAPDSLHGENMYVEDSQISPPNTLSPIVASSNSSDGQQQQQGRQSKNVSSKCNLDTRMKPIAGLVGPGSSEATIQVQNLLQIFNIPQIGYSATSMDLSDKSHYKYFLRVVPPDRHQAQAMVDVVVRFNWTYISAVHSDGNYGVRGMEKFVDLATEKGVCIATADNVASSAEDEAFDQVVDNLMKVPNATVVVCFCEGMTVKKLLQATQRKGLEGRFLIVGSDGWGNRLDVVKGHETAALGALSIKLYSPVVPEFLGYYTKLRPDQPTKNPWFRMFWQQKFKCSLDPQRRDLRGFNNFCTGNESLMGSDQDSKLGFVVKAVRTMAQALHAMHQDMCPGVEGLCPAMDPIKGSVYLDYLLNVSFKSYSEELVHFDSSGDPPGRYEILNYQKIIAADGNVSYDYVTIGHWMTGTLKLNGRPVHWPRLYDRQVKSVCSEPCKMGQAKKVKGVSCCWICTTCLDNEILIENNTDCRMCNLGYWPNTNKTDCEQIVVDFISWHTTEAIVCVTVGFIGILCTLWVAAIFVRFHETPVVKASTRELSYIILAGIALAFSANFFIVAKPEQGFCYLTRIFPGLSFSLIYGALVTKTNRIARILEGSKRISTKKPRFMSATAQVVITVIIIGIECAVIIAMLIYQPANSKFDYPTPKRVRLVCDTSTLGIIVPLGFDLVLILLCTIYAVKTRNLPENFNEAKFIGFTMYATCIIWSGFFPIYFAGENKEVTLSFSVSLSAAIALLLLFVPKVYVIVWVPEKNTRGAFTTSRDVRCHIGSKSLASGDSIDIKESSTFENLFKSDRGNNKQWKQKSLDEKRLRFVMQRASRSDSTSSYINHGVIRKHALLSGGSATIIKEPSRDSARTDSTHISGISSSCSEKDRIFSGGDTVKQFLTSEFRQSRKLSNVRPDSPAEKEKHRIHNMENLPDYCLVGEAGGLVGRTAAGVGIGVSNGGGGGDILSASTSSHPMPRSSNFRKSLSSNCVSMDYKTRSIQCQTGDELLQCLLPALRRRCLSKGKKHILERSTAVDASGQDESDSSVASSSVFLCKSSSSPHQHADCQSHPCKCLVHSSTTCHCTHDLSDLSPLVYEDHASMASSKYKKLTSCKDNTSPQPDQQQQLLPIHTSGDVISPRHSNSYLEMTNTSNTSPCIHGCMEYIQRPAGPSPKLSPMSLRTGPSSPTPSLERRLITTPDCDNICSTVTKYHHDNSTNHFKVVRNSRASSDMSHNHRLHHCHNHHHCCIHPHQHDNHQQRFSANQQPCTSFPCKYAAGNPPNHSPHITASSRGLSNNTSLSFNTNTDKLLGDNISLQGSLDIPLSQSASPYQHLDSNSDSHTTLSTASSSFTLPPFNTSTDSKGSNQSMFSDTSIPNTRGEQRTNNTNKLGDNKDDSHDDIGDDNLEVDEFTPLRQNCGRDDDEDDDDDEDNNDNHSSTTTPLSANMTGGSDVMEFQNYLQSRGINLEFSSEQCSEL